MITIFSEKDSLRMNNAGDYVSNQSISATSKTSKESIQREIQTNLRAIELVDWSE